MSKSLDRLTLLTTFTRIAERGSISAAARDLGLSQPSISRQLAELEDRFGAQLIRRTTHELALTPAGQDLLRDARQLLNGWEALEERHGSGETSIKGRLKVVAPVAFGQLYLADIAFRFQMKHPEVALAWQLDDAAIRFAEIGCDCWLKVGPVPDDTLIVRELGQVERMLVAAPGLAPDGPAPSTGMAEALPLAALEPFEGGRIALTNKNGETTTIAPEVRLATNNIFALHRAALVGLGIAVMPRWFIDDDLKAGRLIDLLPEWRAARLTLNAAYLPTRRQPLRLMRFLETIAAGVEVIPGIEQQPS